MAVGRDVVGHLTFEDDELEFGAHGGGVVDVAGTKPPISWSKTVYRK